MVSKGGWMMKQAFCWWEKGLGGNFLWGEKG